MERPDGRGEESVHGRLECGEIRLTFEGEAQKLQKFGHSFSPLLFDPFMTSPQKLVIVIQYEFQ